MAKNLAQLGEKMKAKPWLLQQIWANKNSVKLSNTSELYNS